MDYTHYEEMGCFTEPDITPDIAVSNPIKERLITATNKLSDLRLLLSKISEGILILPRADPDDIVKEASCINDSARNINMLINQCMTLAGDIYRFMF